MIRRLRPILAVLMAVAALGGAAAQEIVVTFGGDVNFARSREVPLADRVRKIGTHRLGDLTQVLATEWTGDVNFINVETVVSATDGARQGKQFVFRTHPNQMAHLMRLGVNAFALANNHAFDHGWPGLRDTLAFFRSADRPLRPLLFAGIGQGEAAFAPKIIETNGVRVALSALSFGSGSFAPTEDRAGMAYLFARGHYDKVLAGLRTARADIKILSVHYGTENQVTLNAGQAALYRRAVDEAGVHLVLGHHPHVARGVEVLPEQNAAIYYSLGNLLFIGGAAKDSAGLGQDYGLLGKAYFSISDGAVRLKALEAVPFKGVHLKPVRPPVARARATIENLNRLSQRSVGDTAARFTVMRPDAPRGLACFGGPYPPRAKVQCCKVEESLHCALPDLM